MNVWYHLTTIFGLRRALLFLSIPAVLVVLITTIFFGVSAHAQAGTNQTISFQGRLLDVQGGVVPDGYYNVQFKIYQDGTGAAAHNPDGTLKWTETYVNNNGSEGVQVKNGYLSVNLGAKTPFGDSVDWNQDTLWLSMNVAGSSSLCTSFGTAPCSADGEMLPMKRLTATPYALNSSLLGGISAAGFIQNGSLQQAGSFNISGTGAATTLQGNTSVLTPSLDTTKGTLAIGSAAATAIHIGDADSVDQTIAIGTGQANKNITVGSTSNVSALSLQGGSGGVVISSNGEFAVQASNGENGTVDLLKASNQNGQASVSIGDGSGTETPTLLTLDKSDTAPAATGDALLGSMYYDTTLGKVQCYEASGWGNCSASPDTFVSLSPEYAGAVTGGTGTGTLSTGFCSDDLHLNDGSSSQPTICGTHETYNYYGWTAPNPTTPQTKTLYVTYQLPANFKGFVADSTSLLGRTDSSDAQVTMTIHRKTSTGLLSCGDTFVVSEGAQTAWQKQAASDTNDPAECGFEAGDSIVFQIDLNASDDANAYTSTLNFAFKTSG